MNVYCRHQMSRGHLCALAEPFVDSPGRVPRVLIDGSVHPGVGGVACGKKETRGESEFSSPLHNYAITIHQNLYQSGHNLVVCSNRVPGHRIV